MTSGLSRRHSVYLFRILCMLCALAAGWAIVVWLTGGFRLVLAGLRISSRQPRNAIAISLLCAFLAWLLALLPDARNTVRRELSLWRRWAGQAIRIAASAAAVAAVAIAVDIQQWRAALPLWVDEEAIALNVRDRSVGDLPGILWLGQSAPFGWLVLERAAMSILGTGEAAMRAVPLLFGIATLILAVWVGRRWMGRMAAAGLVLLCWIGPLVSHYRFEVKHYTADVFFGLLLPILAVWAIEAERSADRTRRVWRWWIAAAFGHWVANGALLATPACAIFLCVALWRRDGRRAAAGVAIGGLMWLVSFGLHYLISIRYTVQSTFLRSTWIAELLPPSVGLTGALRWFLDRLEPLAVNPGGTGLWMIFWTSAICGWAFARKRPLGLVLAGVALSAFAFSGVVPLHQRFSIWIVPALYTGVALLLDCAVRLGHDAVAHRKWLLSTAAALVLLVQFRLVADILTRGRADLDARRASTDKHRLDDREAVRWLMSQRKPGDVLISTRLALPAVWWYGGIPISDNAGSGTVLDDGSPVYEVGPTIECLPLRLEDALKRHRRVLLYLGFDVNPSFDRRLLSNLAQLGGMTAYQEFSQLGLAAVFDLHMPASGSVTLLKRTATLEHVDTDGCIGIRRAERW